MEVSKIKMTLTVEVVYDLNGTNPKYLESNLYWAANNMAGEGLFTNGTDAEVDEWKVRVAKEPIQIIVGEG